MLEFMTRGIGDELAVHWAWYLSDRLLRDEGVTRQAECLRSLPLSACPLRPL